MADFININPPSDPSNVEGTVKPETDGTFNIEVVAKHDAPPARNPTRRTEIYLDGVLLDKSRDSAWQDGPATDTFDANTTLKAGKAYKIRAQSFNQNATAVGISMTVNRI